MFWNHNKLKIDENVKKRVQFARLLCCQQILSQDGYMKIIWSEKGREEPVYVDDDEVISLISGKTYPIFKRSLTHKVNDISKIKIGHYQVVSLEELPSTYTKEQKRSLYLEGENIYKTCLEKQKNKEKAYS